MNVISKKRQQGAETLEFVAVFFFFMLMLMTVLDLGRALYIMNALTEATRRGARTAIICPSPQDDPSGQYATLIRNVTVFDSFSGSGNSPVVNGLTSGAVVTNYYDAAGAATTNPPDIRFVEVQINNNYQFQFVIPGFNQLVNFPTFRSTLYTESLGAVPTMVGQPVAAPDCNF